MRAKQFKHKEFLVNKIFPSIFATNVNSIEKLFLWRVKTKLSEIKIEGLVARELSKCPCKEECIVTNRNSISFYSSLDSMKNNFSCQVIVKDVVHVE